MIRPCIFAACSLGMFSPWLAEPAPATPHVRYVVIPDCICAATQTTPSVILDSRYCFDFEEEEVFVLPCFSLAYGPGNGPALTPGRCHIDATTCRGMVNSCG